MVVEKSELGAVYYLYIRLASYISIGGFYGSYLWLFDLLDLYIEVFCLFLQ